MPILRRSGDASPKASPRTTLLGASDDAVRYLEATGDVAGLIETVREIASRGDGDPEEFSPERLLQILCADSITIPLEERRVVPVEGLPPLPESESAESLWEMFLRLKSARPKVEFYVPANELLEHFAQAEPHRRERFLETIRKSEETAREELRWVAAKVDELGRSEASPESSESTAKSPPTGEDYMCAQIAGQTPRYPDEEVLKHLLALAFVRKRELDFWNWRRYVLEQPRLWDALAGRGTPIP